jgi:hypothetical protein
LPKGTVEEADQDEESGPRAGGGDHRSVAERQVERPALCAPPEQQQDTHAYQNDRQLDP